MAGQLVVIAFGARTPPGQLSFDAWQLLQAGPALTADDDHRQLPALRAAGVAVTVTTPEVAQARAAAGEDLVWLAGDGPCPQGRLLQASVEPAGSALLDVVAVMDRLRSPGGCPWDARQTHASLMPYLLEEAYETYQALEDGDLVGLREELGDLLLQVVFHARLAQEGEQPWTVDDVAADLVDKLVGRHPHVFAGASADDLEGSWEALKQAEKGRASVTDGVPLSQPALALAAKLQSRAARLGAPVGAHDGLGGELWALVARCRAEGVDPEVALRTTARAFRDTVAAVEAEATAQGRAVEPQDWARTGT